MTDQTASKSAAAPAPPASPRERGHWANVWAQFRSHRGALMGSAVFLFICAMVLFGPYIWTVDPGYQDFRARNMRHILACFSLPWGDVANCFLNPSEMVSINVTWAHPLGTDNIGRDTLARLLFGGRISMAVGLTAMGIALFLGTLVGVLAGYFKRIDGLLMRTTDLFLALPLLPLLLLMVLLFREPLSAAFGTEGGIFILIVTGIGITSWMPTARIVRGDVLALKEREFVLAARSIGTRPGRMILRHVLPNVMSPIMVSATLGIASAIITESALSFLGLGFPPDFPTWGRLLNDGVQYMQQYPERVVWPGLLISVVVLAVNYVGDGLRDALDPRIRGR
ncbi:ABC transporter permease [Aestuariibius sp. 2305UL40-4]|uniref:ABC transporter permease n=1 Tax=Aestuariibius violaceus TaxID=3234132 RepID=UPI00345EDB63